VPPTASDVTEDVAGATPEPATESIMKTPAVRRLVGASGFSSLGSAMVAVAMAFVAFRESGSVVLTVFVLAANALPALLLSPIVGKLATGRDPRTVDAIGQVGKIVISVVLAVVAASGSLTYAVLLIANLANGTVSALTAPAWPRLTRMSAPTGRLAEVTASINSACSIATIVGALAGGIIVAAIGTAFVFAFNALTYIPLLIAIRRVPGTPPTSRREHGTVRRGIAIVKRTDTLRRAFVLAAVLNLAAWPVLSILPAAAHDIDARAHVLGLLTGAFYAGAAAVSWAVVRLRRRFTYGTILFVGFFGAGLLLCANAMLTAWRTPGYDAVFVAAVTLLPIGLAVALDSSLLQVLVQLGTDPEDQAPVLVVYATVTTIVTPIGGLLIGLIADELSLWGALGVSGAALTVLALCLRHRLRVFDELGTAPEHAVKPALHHANLHLMRLLGCDPPGGHAGFFHITHEETPPPASTAEAADDDHPALAREPEPVSLP
jgi:MFS family permease